MMLFRRYEENFKMSNKKFINVHNVHVGSIFSLIVDDDKEVPYTCSSTDKKFSKCICKLYSEHLERIRMGFNYNNSNDISAYDIIQNKLSMIKREYLSYGFNPILGNVDTTGTASGNLESIRLVKKAISELIEKNELFLFWYCGLGEKLYKNQTDYLEKECGMDLYDNNIFLSKNISSWYTIICITLYKNKIVSTGVSCNSNLNSAIKSALLESKIIKNLNSFKMNTMYDFDPYTNGRIYKKIKSYKNKKTKKYHNDKYIPLLDLYISNWVKDINICFLNLNEYNDGKVISVFSSSLLKCIPNDENIYVCKNIPIIKMYREHMIKNEIDCFII